MVTHPLEGWVQCWCIIVNAALDCFVVDPLKDIGRIEYTLFIYIIWEALCSKSESNMSKPIGFSLLIVSNDNWSYLFILFLLRSRSGFGLNQSKTKLRFKPWSKLNRSAWFKLWFSLCSRLAYNLSSTVNLSSFIKGGLWHHSVTNTKWWPGGCLPFVLSQYRYL